jgi:branched-chain amino acid transport system permease protein
MSVIYDNKPGRPAAAPDAGAARPRPLWLRLGGVLLLAALLLGADRLLYGPDRVAHNQYAEDILIRCGLAVILAVSLNIVNGFTGQFSLGHIGFYMVGAYVAAALSTYGHARLFPTLPTDGSPVGILPSAWPILATSLAGGLAAAGIGLLVGLPSLRLRGDYLAIITLGFAQIILVIIRNIRAVDGATAFTGLPVASNPDLPHVQTPHLTSLFWVFGVAALVLWVAYSLRFSVHGLAFLAVREDEIAAEAMGINTTRYKVLAFVLSAFFTGVAGALFAHYQSSLSNESFRFERSVDTVVMVVLGGLGSISGVTLAAVLLTVLPEALRPVAEYRLVVYPLLLVILMLTRPQGIFGREEIGRAWLGGQVAAVRGWFTRRPRPALATGPDVMTTARDRDDVEV